VADGDRPARSAAIGDLAGSAASDLAPVLVEALRARAAQRDEHERQLEEALARAQLEEAARLAVEHARGLFASGHREEALGTLARFAEPSLVRQALEGLTQRSVLVDEAEAAVRGGSPEERRAALDRLGASDDTALLAATIGSLRELDAQLSLEEARQAEAARVHTAIASAHELFERGDHTKAIALLEAFVPPSAPVTTLLQAFREKLRGIEDARAQAEARDEAAALVAGARERFIAGNAEAALQALSGFRAPGLVAGELDILRRAARAIEAARVLAAEGAASERRAAIDELSRLTPPELFAPAIIELHAIDADRTAHEARLEAARLAAEAERAATRARAAFVAGEYDQAIDSLERFQPPDLVEPALTELRTASRALTGARVVIGEGDDPARVAALEQLRAFRPADLVARALDQFERDHLRRREADERLRVERERDAAALRTCAAAQRSFDAGDVAAAMAALKAFAPHPRVTALIGDLEAIIEVREINGRAEQALDAGDLPGAAALLLEAERVRPNDDRTAALRQRLDGATRQARAKRTRRLLLTVGAPAALVLAAGLGSYIFWPQRRPGESRAPQPTGPTQAGPPSQAPAGRPNTAPAPESTVPSPTIAPTTIPPVTVIPPATGTSASIEEQGEALRTRAVQLFVGGQTPAAVNALDRALGINGKDSEARRLRDLFRAVEDAAAEATTARQAAGAASAATLASASYQKGEALDANATKDRRQRRFDSALKNYQAARDAFAAAETEAKAAADAAEAAAEAAKKAAKPGPAPPPPSRPEPDVTPPPTAATPRPIEKPPLKSAEPPVVDEKALIKNAFRSYERGWAAKDVDALRRVWALSANSARQVKESMDGARTMQVDVLVNDGDIVVQGRQATVTCSVRRNYQMRNQGASSDRTDRVTFKLQKRDDGTWVIVSPQ
jgi:hypothetical protein